MDRLETGQFREVVESWKMNMHSIASDAMSAKDTTEETVSRIREQAAELAQYSSALKDDIDSFDKSVQDEQKAPIRDHDCTKGEEDGCDCDKIDPRD